MPCPQWPLALVNPGSKGFKPKPWECVCYTAAATGNIKVIRNKSSTWRNKRVQAAEGGKKGDQDSGLAGIDYWLVD